MRIFYGFAVAVVLFGVTTGCSSLPRSGPNTAELLQAEAKQHNVAVVKLDPATIEFLNRVTVPSLLSTFGDASPAPDQRIGIGDMVQVTLWEASSGGLFSNPAADSASAGAHSATIPSQIVAHDGSIMVPFAGRVAAVGRTPSEIEQAVRDRLVHETINPQILVTVTQNVSSLVTALTEGGSAARVPLSLRGDRLLDVIAQSGGVRTIAANLTVVLTRGGKILRVPLETVLNDPSQNIYLAPGDVITLVNDPKSFTALGATGKNSVVPFETSVLTLDEALGKAGGLLDDRADPAGVFVIRFETGNVGRELARTNGIELQNGGVAVIYQLDMHDLSAFFLARQFVMHNKDIVYVSNAPLSDLEKIFSLLNQLVTPTTTGLVISNSVR